MIQKINKERVFTGNVILRIMTEVRPHWKWMAGFIFFIALTAFIDSANTFMTKYIIDEGVMPKDMEKVYYYGIRILMLFGANSISIFLFIFCAGRVGEWLQSDLREKLFNHLQEMSFSFFDRNSSGWLLSRITSDTRRIAELASWMFLDSIWGVFNIITAVCFMIFIHWKLGLIVLFLMPVLVFIALTFKAGIIREYRKVRSINSEITSAYSEGISGVKVVKALNKQEHNLSRFDRITERMHHASYRAAWLSALFLPLVQLVSSVAVAAVLWYGGWNIQLGELTIGGLRAFIAYITFMLWPIQQLSHVFSEMQQSIASAERVFSLMDERSEIEDRKGAEEKARFKGNIELRGVDFGYVPGKLLFNKFNLSIKARESIAIVGPTGGGKTTLVNLISRYYEINEGDILFDGVSIQDYSQKALQARIGVVLQKPHLFSGTIRENILYGRLDATEEEMLKASKAAAAHDMITALPHAYDEEIGEEGTLLSLGQKQLISLARTILADPDIIIMDEATSSIDTLTEQRIHQGMEALLKGRTSLIIAHRLSTIREADRILVIEDGRIKEEGNHASLLQERGHYYGLYTSQFRSEKMEGVL